MITLSDSDFIIGVWYAKKIKLGAVWVYAIRPTPSQCKIYTHFSYDHVITNSSDFADTELLLENVSNEKIKKICEDKIQDLMCLFNSFNDHILIMDTLGNINYSKLNKKWLPPIHQLPNK